MKFTRLTPNIFYTDIRVGLKLFVDCLEFEIGHDDLQNPEKPLCVAGRDGLAVFLIQDKEYAEKDRPELRLETKNIDEVYAHVKSKFPELLHPNMKEVTLRPWGARELGLLDESGVCVVVQQWG
ncbi:MAG TPA: hypothetical protein VFU15_04510 [Bacteroidia bacterium]|nr:hypothetical protein [Bacteroidia bacterium]